MDKLQLHNTIEVPRTMIKPQNKNEKQCATRSIFSALNIKNFSESGLHFRYLDFREQEYFVIYPTLDRVIRFFRKVILGTK